MGFQKRTIIVIVANNHLLDLAILAHLAPKVLVKGIEVVLQLARIHLVLRIVGRVLVQVRQQDRLRVRRLDVFARTAIAVAAGADLVVKGAVDFVLLGAEDGGEVVGHIAADWGVCVWRGKTGEKKDQIRIVEGWSGKGMRTDER